MSGLPGVAVRALSLAAAPTFVLMAWIAATGEKMSLCSPSSAFLPLDGMVAMYLLMSLFHLLPWLRLAEPRRLSSSAAGRV